MGWRWDRKRTAWLIVATVVAVLPVGGVAVVRAVDDRPRLGAEIERLVPLVDATAREAVPGRAWSPSLLNPALSPAALKDPRGAAGVDRCDSWWNRVLEGWQSGYGYQLAVPDDAAWQVVAVRVRAYWEGLGYDVEVAAIDDEVAGEVMVDLGHSRLSLYRDRVLRQALLMGSTDCLPTGKAG